MIRPALVHLAGLWLAREIGEGKFPSKLAVPLTFLISRLNTPLLVASIFGYALHRRDIERRSRRATDVTPKPTRKPATKKPYRAKKRPAEQAKP